MRRVYQQINVLEAARERISWTFDNFQKIYCSFSGGKDSTVMTHLVMEEAQRRGRKVGLLFIDWECQITSTIDHVRAVFDLYRENIDPYWISLPVRTWNGCSQFEPEWTAWDPAKEDLWVRPKEPGSIQDPMFLPFYFPTISFEEFVELFAAWYGDGELAACFVGIRTAESLNRFRTIANHKKKRYADKPFSTHVIGQTYNVYPIYDWSTEDDWTYLSKFKKCYNVLYDRFWQAGMTIHQMRIDEPFGDTQRKNLWLYQVIEPELWAKMVIRVSGANTANLYSRETGNVMGNGKVKLPDGHTWQSFALMLLETMPRRTAEHYKGKIAVYTHWFASRGYPDGIPDESPWELESINKAPAWRRVVRTLLRNDYWCRGMGFSPTKSQAYEKYVDLMKRRRKAWGIFPETEDKIEAAAV